VAELYGRKRVGKRIENDGIGCLWVALVVRICRRKFKELYGLVGRGTRKCKTESGGIGIIKEGAEKRNISCVSRTGHWAKSTNGVLTRGASGMALVAIGRRYSE